MEDNVQVQEASVKDRSDNLERSTLQEQPRGSRLKSAIAGDSITFLIGPLQNPFTVHKGLIDDCSQTLQQYVGEHLVTDGSRRVFELPDVGEETFAAFSSWLYASKIDVGSVPSTDDLSACAAYVHHLPGLWLFGDKYGVNRLMDGAVTSLIAFYRHGYRGRAPLAHISKVLRRTSGAYRFNVKLCARAMDPTIWQDQKTWQDHKTGGVLEFDFVVDVAGEMASLLRSDQKPPRLGAWLQNLNLADFHEETGRSSSSLKRDMPNAIKRKRMHVEID